MTYIYTQRHRHLCVHTDIYTHTRTRICVCEACCALVTKPRCLRLDTLTNEHLIRYTNCKCVLDSFPIWYYRYFLRLQLLSFISVITQWEYLNVEIETHWGFSTGLYPVKEKGKFRQVAYFQALIAVFLLGLLPLIYYHYFLLFKYFIIIWH